MAIAAITALTVPLFLPALYPRLGFDQTLYHLPSSRAFAASGGVPFLPALRYPVFPQLAEVLDAAVLLFAGDVATQLVGWTALVACIGLVFVWARELSSPAGGWIAAAMLAGSPIAFYLASTGYVEPLLALFGLAALYAAMRGRQESSLAWLVSRPSDEPKLRTMRLDPQRGSGSTPTAAGIDCWREGEARCFEDKTCEPTRLRFEELVGMDYDSRSETRDL
jgi:hypothetical protein